MENADDACSVPKRLHKAISPLCQTPRDENFPGQEDYIYAGAPADAFFADLLKNEAEHLGAALKELSL